MPKTAIAADEPTCPIDGKPVVRQATGRPPVYCSARCRKVAAARNLRRLARLGRAVERALRDQL
jgi:hypothetical protein